MRRHYWWWGLGALVLCAAIAVGIWIVRTPEFSADYIPPEQREELEAGLTLRDVILEQQDQDGQLLWRVNADEVTYSPDQKSANLVRLEGELYQDGELLYRVKADKGRIREDGQTIFLDQNIVATGIQNQITLKGDILQWRSEQDVMIVRNNLTGSHPQIQARANEARVYNRAKRVDFTGEVVANTVVSDRQKEPWTKLQSETLRWQWEAEEIGSDQPIKVERFQAGRVTEVMTGNKGLFEIAANRATVTDDVRVRLAQVPLNIESDLAVWEIAQAMIQINRPVKIANKKDKLTLTSQQGQLDVAKQIVYLNQDVVVLGQTNNSRLTTDRLRWNLKNQTFLAEGTVNYRQRNPQVTVRGPRATGRIEQQTLVVDGGRVVTEIVPDDIE
ncbi:MAG: LPS export ABC transporter periplasmic protein LptC [Cyanobacteria bacterium P01_F01_bin.86]